MEEEGGEDFVVQKKTRGKRKASKRRSIPSSDSDDEFIPSAANGKGTKRSCNEVDSAPKQRLSRDEKQYQRALEQAITVSQNLPDSSNSTATNSTSRRTRQPACSSKDKEPDETSSAEQKDEEGDEDDDESDFSPPDEAVDSDDDFQPDTISKSSKVSKPRKASKAPKPASKTNKTSNKSGCIESSTSARKGRAKDKDAAVADKVEVSVGSAATTTCTVQKTQLPGGRKMPVRAPNQAATGLNARLHTGISATKMSTPAASSPNISTSGRNSLKPAGLKISPSVRTGGISSGTGRIPVKAGGAPSGWDYLEKHH